MGLQHDLTAECWQKLNAERDPWRILAIGSEATAWWIHARSNPHVAAEMVIGTYELCRGRNADIANLWLRSLVITSLWADLLTQSFFRSWLRKTAPELLPAEQGEEQQNDSESASTDVSAWDSLGINAQAIPVDAYSAADFIEACAAALEDLRRWEAQDGRLERNVGGFNVLQALNMSRWYARRNVEAPGSVYNAAAFGLEFLPANAERHEGSLLKKVLDGEVEIHAVTLGTRPNQG